MKDKILIISPSFLNKPRKGYEVIAKNHVEYLCKYYDVRVFSISKDPVNHINARYSVTYAKKKWNMLPLWFFTFLFTAKPLRSFESFVLFSAAHKLMPEFFDVDCVIFYTSRAASFASTDLLKKSIIISIDPLPLFYRHLAKFDIGFFYKLVLRFESILMLRLDKKLIRVSKDFALISKTDIGDYSAALSNNKNIKHISYGVETNRISRCNSIPPSIVVTGNFGFLPNKLALKFVIDELWPVLSRYGLFKLIVAGSGLTHKDNPISSDSSIELIRNPECMKGILKKSFCSLSLVDMPHGIQSKVLESMAAGLPVVALHSSVKGMQDITPHSIITVENLDPEKITAKIICLFRDSHVWSLHSINCIRYIKKYNSLSRANSDLLSLI